MYKFIYTLLSRNKEIPKNYNVMSMNNWAIYVKVLPRKNPYSPSALEQTAHFLLLLDKHLKVLINDGDGQQYTSTTSDSTCIMHRGG